MSSSPKAIKPTKVQTQAPALFLPSLSKVKYFAVRTLDVLFEIVPHLFRRLIRVASPSIFPCSCSPPPPHPQLPYLVMAFPLTDWIGSGSHKRRRCEANAASAGYYATHLLIKILMQLPPKSLFRCSTMSKEWYSIISDPNFLTEYAKRNSNRPISGFVMDGVGSPYFEDFFFVSLSGNVNGKRRPCCRDPSFLSVPEIKIQTMCNGLLCYSKLHKAASAGLMTSYYMCNPTSGQTRRIRVFEHPIQETVLSVCLAFDPLKSLSYNLIFVRRMSCSGSDQLIKIDIYCSKTQSWRSSSKGLFNVPRDREFNNEVYYDGTVYWYDQNHLCYFDLVSDSFKDMKIPQLASMPHYLGESDGRLLMVGVCRRQSTSFTVYEMKKGRAGWLAKYQGDFTPLLTAFPKMVVNEPTSPCRFVVATLLEGKEADELSIVLKVPRSIVQYNVKDKTFKELRRLPRSCTPHFLPYAKCRSYKFIESLACI